ncbi:glycosyltransferase family 39 protein [Saccharopolyspora sp. K220]|uniref:glycosyltransferase family 39 protein n=1 Tax=Saccharopolyspora soli TaxID=2926618 RepID=UPI001F584FC5|nr:glycosyltransferase family 39 protein [Saccharopolyspora soli]MCI2422025.1 glycosyltransferase family 39 protein [Saccharopolyspora soli]
MSTTPSAVDPPVGSVGNTAATQRKQLGTGLLDRVRRGSPQQYRLIVAFGPAVVYLAIRLVGLLVLAWLSAANDEALVDNLRAWDGQWYLEIAEHGYGGVNPDMVDGFGHRYPETPLAFFPGYPLLITAFSWIPGVSTTGGAITASLACGVAAAYGLARLGRRVGGSDGVGLLLVVLFAAAPMSVVLSMAYSEAMFCALSIWALIGVIERNWPLAGLCCAAAGLVRPTAAALLGVVGLAALIAIVQRRDTWRPWLALVLAPAGMLLYIGWVGWQTSNPTGYFSLQQRGWSSAFDGGVATGKFMIESLTSDKSVLETFTVWIVLAALVLLVLCFRLRMPWPLMVFAAAVLVLDLGSDGLMYSKVRLMLPAFPLLIPVAIGLSRRRTTTAVTTAVLLVFFGSWFGAYSLTAWDYAI